MNEVIDLLSLSKAGGVVKFEITADELSKFVQNVVKETVEVMLLGFKEQHSPDLVTRRQARDLLNVRTDLTMMRWEGKGYLMPHRIGSRIFYRKDEVISAVEKFSRQDQC